MALRKEVYNLENSVVQELEFAIQRAFMIFCKVSSTNKT